MLTTNTRKWVCHLLQKYTNQGKRFFFPKNCLVSVMCVTLSRVNTTYSPFFFSKWVKEKCQMYIYLALPVLCIMAAFTFGCDGPNVASVRFIFYLLDCSNLAANMCSIRSLALLKGQA